MSITKSLLKQGDVGSDRTEKPLVDTCHHQIWPQNLQCHPRLYFSFSYLLVENISKLLLYYSFLIQH